MAEEVAPGYLVGGQYRLVELIGSGGFGRVWKAVDETLEVDVAVKQIWLPQSLSADERADALRRATREARNAARLRDHPNIVTVHTVVVDGDSPWIVMRWVEGQSLDSRIRTDGRVPVAEARRIATGLLSALEAAHAAGILHRDVKPGNVLLGRHDEVLLADFGIAVHPTDTTVTATGMFIGSAEYMAPERLRGSDEPAGDLFSLGVTLYHAVEGVSPFHRTTAAATITAVMFDDPPELKHASDLTPLITALLAKDPADRPSIGAARQLLDTPTVKLVAPPTKKLPPSERLAPPRKAAPERPVKKQQVKQQPAADDKSSGGSVLLQLFFWALVIAMAFYVVPKVIAPAVGAKAPGSAASITEGHVGDCSAAAEELPSYRKVPCWYRSAGYKLLSIEHVTSERALFNLGDDEEKAACAGVPGWDAGTSDSVKSGDEWLVFCLGSK
ncbi:serine/threonine-protein kinase [Kribbella soli]|uniref:serine/threonine-protein kinase n=1 Tax=Kribbella soli TaxID=1124743 RepID=UPI0013F41810|nr:serine/threonine-protein kinase [Kribbella soli]